MKYKRNAQAVFEHLVETKADQLVCKKDCKIQIPVRFTTRGLGYVGKSTYTLGCFPIILADTLEYGVLNANALVEINPFKTTIVTIEGVEYYEFTFEAGQVVINNLNVVCRSDMMFNILDELVIKGKVPWYIEYEDLGDIFSTAGVYAASRVGSNAEVIELIVSMMARTNKDRSKHIRHFMESYEDIRRQNVDFIPLISVYYAVNSTVNKLAGAYFNDGVTSALVNPTERVDKIEKILRA